MNKINLFSYYHFGTCQRFLQDAKQGLRIGGHGRGYILDNLRSILSYLDAFDLKVTKRAAWMLIEFQNELTALSVADEKATLTEEMAQRLKKHMNDLRMTLDAELQGFEAHIISPKRLDHNKLSDDVSSLFAPNIYASLPEIARFDFAEAGKCLVFERPTAAAFHLLRGTESVLRHYYCSLIKQNRIKSMLWGPIVQDLRVRPKTKKYETLYNHLDNLRVSFRNPTQHPEAVYDINEAQDLWSLCIEVVNRMMKILTKSDAQA